MAALVLSFAGAGAGGALFGAAGAVAGRIAGALGGGMIDRALFGSLARKNVQGPRLSDLDVMGSTEGAPIPRVYGRARIAAQLIWATKLEEVVSTRSESAGGGKGGGPRVTTTTYSYFANVALGLCEGPIARIGRVWADGMPLDLEGLDVRLYPGTEDQLPDTLIEAKEGAGYAPAYRGLAYLVFERLPLEKFGNRIPQISVEILRPVGRLERMIRAVTMIPGATEFGYEPSAVTRNAGFGTYAPENRHITSAQSDWSASLDELQAVCPNIESVALVVAWFGSDLRANHCEIRPGVDRADKQTKGATWAVAGRTRNTAYVVSATEGRGNFGGTPSDASVIHAIRDLHARGLKVTLYPFVMMDIAPDNTLSDPWTGAASQPAFPWRGRITCDPAPGQSGSPDGTALAESQIDALFGAASPAHFSLHGEDVVYSGPDEWTLRRMALHYAKLCQAAGGVEAFLIGSEYEALTRVRSAPGVYPAVAQLVSLAEAVKAMLPAAKISYAANWTEYGAHVVDAGASEVRFPLDALWASDAIDFIGVDYYAPLSDWRDGNEHLDSTLAETIYDPDYLRSGLRSGEAYDFFYPDDAARRAQTRAPITDSLGKPWLFRAKDLWSFWSEPHYERVDGIELAEPTAWLPRSKPFWLTEAGCPAVDKGANQPNVFPDPKSAAAGLPYFSNGRRDDLIQRRYLEAAIAQFDPAFGAAEADNPSGETSRMLDPGGIHIWTWDARPYPAFPLALDVWSDGPNWDTGHWLTGRLGGAPLDDLVVEILLGYGIDNFDASALRGNADGYVIDRPMSARAALESIAQAFAFNAIEEGDLIRFRPRGGKPVATITAGDLIAQDNRPDCRIVRAQETELPNEITLGFTEVSGDFHRAAVRSRRLVGSSRRESSADLALIMSDAVAERAAEIWLQDLWAGRESMEFSLGASHAALTPGDIVTLDLRGRTQLIEINGIVDAEARSISARSIDPEIFSVPARVPRSGSVAVPAAYGPPYVIALDVPQIDDEAEPALQLLAVQASPWPGAEAVWRASGGGFERVALATMPAIVGETLDAFAAGPTARWDNGNAVRVRLAAGMLSSADDLKLLNGANAAAIRTPIGWEVFQFGTAELVAENTYILSRLLRGQLGTEWAMGDPAPVGSAFVLLDRSLVATARGADFMGRSFDFRVGAANLDVGSDSMTGFSAAVGNAALMPWSPCHVRGVRTGEGIAMSWIRRTRKGGDNWDTVEVPLGEDTEAYRIEILSGDEVVRAAETASSQFSYAAADEIADFGAPQSELTVRIRQLSAVAGAGRPQTAVLHF
ncbi:MAG TPA: glycoside hydrolase/phage tail family protein [Xanthobacteraceae bacterium]|nr:glycoside hydrolase/phage tail family protein [Xanthobacteraceae bacterium]